MSELMIKLPPAVLVIMTIMFASAFLIVVKLFLNSLKTLANTMSAQIELTDIKLESTIHALGKVLPSNGSTFNEHYEQKRNSLLKIYDRVHAKVD